MRPERIIAIVLFLIMLSCEQDRQLFNGPYYVQFTDARATVLESDGDPVKIMVHYNGPALEDDDMRIYYSITGDARENIDYVIEGERGFVTIPEDENFGIIEVTLINNANNILRSQDLILSMETVDLQDIRIGQNANGPNKQFTLTIEDDCILGGKYLGTKEGLITPEEDIYILSNDCVEYLLTNWDVGGDTFFGTRPLFFLDNNDNTLTIPEQQDPTLQEGFNTLSGFGVINPSSNEITFNLDLVDLDTAVIFTLIPDR